MLITVDTTKADRAIELQQKLSEIIKLGMKKQQGLGPLMRVANFAEGLSLEPPLMIIGDQAVVFSHGIDRSIKIDSLEAQKIRLQNRIDLYTRGDKLIFEDTNYFAAKTNEVQGSEEVKPKLTFTEPRRDEFGNVLTSSGSIDPRSKRYKGRYPRHDTSKLSGAELDKILEKKERDNASHRRSYLRTKARLNQEAQDNRLDTTNVALATDTESMEGQKEYGGEELIIDPRLSQHDHASSA